MTQIFAEPNSLPADNVTIGNTTTEILAYNANRVYAAIVNDSDQDIYLAFGEAAVMNKGIRINANGGSYEILIENLWLGTVNGICSSGSKNVCVVEGVRTN